MKILAVGGILFCASSGAWAQDWAPLDARSRSLGGAGVAFADGRADSLYWNPASLAVGSEKVLDFSTGFSFSFSAYTDAHVIGKVGSDLTHVLDLYDNFDFQTLQGDFNSATPTFTETDVQNATRIIDSISALGRKGEGGLLLNAGGGFNLRVGPVGLFVHGGATAGGVPLVDFNGVAFTSDPANFFTHLQTLPSTALSPAGTTLRDAMIGAGLASADASNLAAQAQLALGDAAISDPAFINAMTALARGTATGATTDLYNNPSGAFIRGLAQVEAGISFAVPVLPTLLDFGISFKEVISETSYSFVSFADQDSGTGIGNRVKDDLRKDNVKRSTNFNVDMGVRATPFEWLTLGIAGRNIVPMNLDFAGPGGKMHVDPQARFGAMLQPVGAIKLGFDIDMLKNESPVLPGYHMQHFGAGVEFDLPVIKFRFGWDDNLAYARDHGRVTFGLGLDFFGYFVLDLGLQGSLNKIEYKAAKVDGSEDAKTFPSDRVSAGVSFGVNLPF